MLGGIALFACDPDIARTTTGGHLSGQVVVSGPLRHAAVSVDQIDLHSTSTIQIRTHLADTTTDDEGRFTVDVGEYNGWFLMTTSGGTYTDLAASQGLATGVVIQLDPTVHLESITRIALLDERDDLLISPIGHLIAARARAKLRELGNLDAAVQDAATHLNQHFGDVTDWTSLRLASLDASATSPTEPVRAAFVQAGLSYLANYIASQAGASPQDVTVVTLMQQMAADLADGSPFDGNDRDNPAPGSGLQVGDCAPKTDCNPPSGCDLGCRSACDLYSGTPRWMLGGEITSVAGLPMNHTGLLARDVLAPARAMATDPDTDLFGNECAETLDRLPPNIAWVTPTPAELAYVRASFGVAVVASDDTDPRPQVTIAGAPNVLTDTGALATFDSTAVSDGMLDLVATARDMSGNTSTLHRVLHVDNTPPALTLDPTGYVVDGETTWWTASTSPAIAGTVSDASPVAVAVSTSATAAPATVVGAAWTSSVPGPLDLVGADVTATATDAAGNRTQLTRHIRADVTPPVLSFPTNASAVLDEATEKPTFNNPAAAEGPVHTHNGAAVNLDVVGSCPKVTKYSYLLGAASPPYVSEVDATGAPFRNPVRYVLDASDDGIGIVASSVQYRVGARSGDTTTWLLNWTAATSAPSAALPAGTSEYNINLVSDQIPQLSTTEGVYEVQFQATDRLGRTATADRCFELHLRAPPLHFQTPGQQTPGDVDMIPVATSYQLSGLVFGGTVASRLLNNDATGASLLDEDVTQGTASTVYLQVNVSPPSSVSITRTFKESNIVSSVSVSASCIPTQRYTPPVYCNITPKPGPSYASQTTSGPSRSLTYPVKVFELDSNLNPASQVSCTVCGGGTGNQWTFAIPPRDPSGAAPPRRFKVMTMIGAPRSELWPSENGFTTAPPYADLLVEGFAFTGSILSTSQGCSDHEPIDPQVIAGAQPLTTPDTCVQVTTYTSYLALTSASIHLIDNLATDYSTAPTLTTTPTVAVGERVLFNSTSDATWNPHPPQPPLP